MKLSKLFIMTLALATLSLGACGGNPGGSTEPSEGEKKSIEITNAILTNDGNKAYVSVTGTQTNYTANDFKWAWGIVDTAGEFVDGEETPSAASFKSATFDANNRFTVRYCLTDITDLVAGELYRIYGGTPETYGDITFPSNNTGASDATRKYYLRSDQSNALVFDNIQPISFTKASVVNVAEADLPTGVTNAGAYVKFGGANSKNLTIADLDALNTGGKIGGNFQRVIGEGYDVHAHVNEERFYKIEGNDIFFYCYVGFIAEGEGWMVHFDLVSGNSNANLQFDSTLNGETLFTVGDAGYRVYADKNKGGEENYWGCLGVYREAIA